MLSAVAVCGQRWQIAPDGRGIVWKVGSDIPHDDHIEMSGERMAFVLRWGVDSRGAFRQERSLVFPLLRTLPNNTHASLMYRMAASPHHSGLLTFMPLPLRVINPLTSSGLS